jgi:hypothetical protein
MTPVLKVPTQRYHKAPPTLRQTIEANGLKTSVGDSYALHWQDTNKKLVPAVFAYDKNVKVYDSTYDDDIWEIDTSKLQLDKWRQDPDGGMYKAYGSVIYLDNIPASAIRLVYKGTGKDS